MGAACFGMCSCCYTTTTTTPSTSFRDVLKYINPTNTTKPFLHVYHRNFNEIYIIILNANLDVLSDLSFYL